MSNQTNPAYLYDAVVLIDDDPVSNYLSKHVLKKSPWMNSLNHIISFEDPKEGLFFIAERLSANLHLLLLLDINMPVLTGWDVLDVLANYPSDILEKLTVYLLSSSTNQAEVERSLTYGFVAGFLSKPLIDNLTVIFPPK